MNTAHEHQAGRPQRARDEYSGRSKTAPWALAALLASSLALPAHAEMSTEELAKLAQNPVGNLIPFALSLGSHHYRSLLSSPRSGCGLGR